MRIAAAEVAFASAHMATASVERRLQITVVPPVTPAVDSVSLSPEAVDAAADPEDFENLPPMLALLKRLIEEMLGHEIRLAGRPLLSRLENAPAAAPPSAVAGGTRIEYSEHREESEHLQVAAEGWVQTQDGRRIAFNLSLELNRQYAEDFELNVETGELARRKKDPLVINFDGTAAQLASARFEFDIDADGKSESVSTLGAGSAFLVLDINRDGHINDGRELFGARSGDGFSDLAAYDDDGNGWIDESDAVYSRLALWQPDNGGDGVLRSLAESDVGAIHLGRVASAFEYRDGDNAPVASLRNTGVYLQESGGAGTVQQLDLFV